MQHHTLVICPVPTGLILSFQYEIVTYLYIEHQITGFTKLPDTGGYGELFTKKPGINGYGSGQAGWSGVDLKILPREGLYSRALHGAKF